jgi:serine/threonine-protein kinase
MDDLTGRTIDGRYRVRRRLGQGGMGVVYEAQDLHDGSRCALKMLRPDLTHDPRVRRRFVDEAASLARLDHPNIVRMRDFFCAGQDCFIALDFVDGPSLAEVIDQGGALAPQQALAILKPILAALDHGHRQLVVHRDVKPSNILLRQGSGVPLLCDFGIAKQLTQRGVTLAGATLGTPEYMSPEQVRSPDRVDLRSDVYSAGIVLFEMLTGRVPFTAGPGDSDFPVRAQQLREAPPDPAALNPAVSPALARVVLKALRKDPATRHQGCQAFCQALERVERGEVDAAPPDGRRRYSVYGHPTLGHAAVKRGFSWPASLLGVFWMFGKGLHVQAAVWAAALLILCLLLGALPAGSGLAALTWLALPALWGAPGFFAGAWQERALRRRGFTLAGSVCAATAHDAVARATGRG